MRTEVSGGRAVVGYDPECVAPETIRRTIENLGMTVNARTPPERARRSLPDLIGRGVVSIACGRNSANGLARPTLRRVALGRIIVD